MNKLIFAATLVLVSCLCPQGQAASASTDKPNVLIVLTDD